MNPFKHKQLEEFTIEDCESYINRYPYGEHTVEVKRLLKELKKQKASQIKGKTATDSKKQKSVKIKDHSSAKEESNNVQPPIDIYPYDRWDDWKRFFRVIGTIIVIVIAIAMVSAIAEGYVYTGPPIALVAFWVIRAIWKDS